MDSQTVSWDLYRSFLAVVREGSLSGAGRRLGLTQPTIGRHVAALEDALAVRLFTRAPQGLVPTDAALDLVPHAERLEAAAAALVRAASGEPEEARGTVRITASDIIGCEVLPPILARFRDAHPRVAMELVTSNRMTNLLTREADIAVRMARPEQGALVARRIGSVPVRLYAHRRYAERRGLPQSVAELSEHSAIGFDADSRSLTNVDVKGFRIERDRFDFRTDNDVAQLAALRAGLGIGAAQIGVAARETDLLPVLHDEVQFGIDMWLAMHEDLRAVRRVRLMFDHLGEELAVYCRSDG